MALIDNLRRVTHRLLRSHPRAPARSHSDPLPPVIDPSPRQEINQDSADATVDKGVSGEKSVATMSSEELGADRRLVFRDEAEFVVARGQALPFADDTFDGVLCLNALHHLPSYAAALREIRRVLKPGGRAVFSEPGTAHAVQPLSQFRMRE